MTFWAILNAAPISSSVMSRAAKRWRGSTIFQGASGLHSEHHGTTEVYVFWRKAVEAAGGDEGQWTAPIFAIQGLVREAARPQ